MRLNTFLSAKLHRIRVTEAQVNYIGSVGIDANFMERAGIRINEQVHIVNLDNGNRWVTYAIPASPGSKTMSLNGGGALLGKIGDPLVVMAYVQTDEHLEPRVLFFNEDNVVIKVGTTEAHGTRHPDLEGGI